jgi:gliding motility-associated-like protein
MHSKNVKKRVKNHWVMVCGYIITVLALLLFSLFCQAGDASGNILDKNRVLQGNNIFIENKGQLADAEGNVLTDVLFKIKLNGLEAYFRKNGVSFVLQQLIEDPSNENIAADEFLLADLGITTQLTIKAQRIDLAFQNTSSQGTIEGENQSQEYFNYYYSHCPDGITGVKGFEKIVYKNLYEGIDAEFYTKFIDGALRLKYDLIVQPDANPDQITYKYITDKLNLAPSDQVIQLETNVSAFSEHLGAIFQEIDGEKTDIKGKFAIDKGLIHFDIDKYDDNQPLIIDPFFTYYGTTSADEGKDVETDSQNDVVIVGSAQSLGLPVSGTGYSQNYTGRADIFIIKLNSQGTRLWSTYYGGDEDSDYGYSVAIDDNDDIYICGISSSDNFPTSTPSLLQGSSDGILVSLDAFGVRKWANYFGGNEQDVFMDICLDQNQDLIVCGATESINIPIAICTPSNYKGGFNYGDGYLAKFNTNGVFQFGTYLGGNYDDICYAVAIDNNNDILVTGMTQSNDFTPTLTGFRDGDWDVFTLKVSAICGFDWGALFGGSGPSREIGNALDIDPITNDVIVGGETGATNFPVINGRNQILGSPSTFLRKFDEDGNDIWSTYYEGKSCNDLKVDNAGNIWITGRISAINLSTNSKSFQQNRGGSDDAYVAYIAPDGVTTNCATYYGGSGKDEAKSIALDNIGNVYITGNTASNDLPGVDGTSVQSGYAGGTTDAFIASICSNCGDSPTITIAGPAVINICSGEDVTINAAGSEVITWTATLVGDYNALNITGIDNINAEITEITADITVTACVGAGGPGCLVCETVAITVVTAPTIVATPADVTICPDDAPHDFTVDLLGATPWTLRVKQPDGSEVDVPCSGTPCVISAAEAGCYTLLKVTDAACFTDYNEEFCLNFYDLPTATIAVVAPDDADICPGETVDLEVNFANTGSVNYGFKYTVDGLPAGGNDVPLQATNPYTIVGVGVGEYEIIEVSDDNCLQTITDQTITITEQPLPTLTITNVEHSNADNTIWICEGENATITFNYTGTGPFVVDSMSTNDGTIGDFPGGNLTVSNPGTYSFPKITDANCESDALTETINVAFYDVPTVSFTATPNPICVGDKVDLTFTFTGDGDFDLNFTDANLNFSNKPTGHIVTDYPIVDTDYEITTLTDVHDCEVDVTEIKTVVVHKLITLESVTETCNATNEQYTITIKISGGDVLGYDFIINSPAGLAGNFVGDTWSSTSIVNSGDIYDIDFFDANSCNIINVTGQKICNCATDAGTMLDITEQKLCDGDMINPTHDGNQVLDPNDMFSFVLSSVAVPAATGDIVLWSNTGIIGYDPAIMTCDVTYYLLALAGNDLAGKVDFDERCFQATNAIPVLWRTFPTASFDSTNFSLCAGESVNVKVNMMGCVNSYDYVLDIPYSSASPATQYLAAGNTYKLTSIAYSNAPACAQTIDETLVITALDSPTLVSKTEICINPTSFEVTINLTGGVPPYRFEDNSGSTGTFGAAGPVTDGGGNTFKSIFPNGGYNISFYDANNCTPLVVSGNKMCNCTSDAGTIAVNPIILCEDGSTSIIVTNPWSNDGNDVFEFVLHDGSGVLLGNILGRDPDGNFLKDTLDCGTVYYVTGISGNDDATGHVDMTDPCLSKTAGVEVIWRCAPSYVRDQITEMCDGASDSITFTMGDAAYNYKLVIDNVLKSDVSSPYNHPFTVAGNMSIVINKIGYNTIPYCYNTVDDTIKITPLEKITLVSQNVICNANNDRIQITVQLADGDPVTYRAFGSSAAGGNFNANRDIWTSDWLIPGAYNVSFEDTNQCNVINDVNGNHICACGTDAGTIDVAPIIMCETDQSNVTITSTWTGDSNDVFEFVLHSGNGIMISDIKARNKTGAFSLDSLACDKIYYITGRAGNDDGNGNVDAADACLSQTAGVEVMWRCTPNYVRNQITELCDGASDSIAFTMNNAAFQYKLDIDNVLLPDINSPYQHPITVAGNTDIIVNRIGYNTMPFCYNTVNDTISIKALDSPELVSESATCNSTNDSIHLSVTLQNGDEDSYDFRLITPSGSGTFTGDTWTSTGGLAPGNYEILFFDKNGCDTVIVKGNKTCPCTSYAGTVDNTALNVCDGLSTSVTHNNDYTFDGNDMLDFVLHDGSDAGIGANVIHNNTGVFVYPGAPFVHGFTYYIHAVVGNNLNGAVDLSDNCLSKSAGIPVVFRELPSLTVSALPNDSLCIGDKGQVQFNFPTGTGPFSVNSSEGLLPPLNNNETKDFFPAETTTILFDNITGTYCSAAVNEQITFTLPEPFSITQNQTEITCHDNLDGTLDVMVSGGYGNYTYQWLDVNGPILGEESDAISDLGPGNYEVEITDALACQTVANFTLAAPPLFHFNFVDVIKELCFENKDGEIRVQAIGGIKYILGSRVAYPWQDTAVFLNMHYLPGSNLYEIIAEDINGCTADTTMDITGLSPITWVNISPDQFICPNTAVILSAEATGGNGDFTYFWDNGTDTLQVDNYNVTPTEDSEYCVYAKDENGCPSSTKECVWVTVPDDLQIVPTAPTHICNGDSGILSSAVGGGVPTYNYLWTNLSNGVTENTPNWFVEPITTTTYTLDITDDCGTTLSDKVTVIVPDPIDVTISLPENVGCTPHTALLKNTTVGNFNNAVWDFGEGKSSKPYDDTPYYEWKFARDYTITLDLEDMYGCAYHGEELLTVNQSANADFEISPNRVEALLPKTQLINLSTYAESFEWTIDSLGIKTEPSPYLTFPPMPEGRYQICLAADNNFGCPDTICKNLIIEDENLVFVPNFFTPNDDNINDVFSPVLSNRAVNLYEFLIFDRWGELIFKTEEYGIGWDGIYKNKAAQLAAYTWTLRVRFEGEAPIRKYMGVFTLGK